MGLEIERKYWVTGEYKSLATDCSHIVQGYISRQSGRTVRVRLRDHRAWLTIKGPSARDGLTRFEWEREIPLDDARQLLELCEGGTIDKHRYIVPWQGHVVEVDEFHGDNDGLVMAEIELRSADDSVDLPPFLGRELTGDRRFYNSNLLVNPYRLWAESYAKENAL